MSNTPFRARIVHYFDNGIVSRGETGIVDSVGIARCNGSSPRTVARIRTDDGRAIYAYPHEIECADTGTLMPLMFLQEAAE